MSAYDEWRPNASRPYNDLEEAFNAGMERAAEIAWRTGMKEDAILRMQEAREVGAKCAKAIRKAIKQDDTDE